MDYFSKNRAFTRNDSKLMRNEEIKEIYDATATGTKIEIRP